MNRYIVFKKPYGVLSQFTPEDGAQSLAEFDLPKGIYPAGRLDKDSEGLLLLTNDGGLIERLLNPANEKKKTYWVLVEREPNEDSLLKMSSGLKIENYISKPCDVKIMNPQPIVYERNPPVRYRKSVKDFWLEVILTEGKNRQVRKMTAAIGHPTLRLIRVQMANIRIDGLELGQWREIKRNDIIF